MTIRQRFERELKSETINGKEIRFFVTGLAPNNSKVFATNKGSNILIGNGRTKAEVVASIKKEIQR